MRPGLLLSIPTLLLTGLLADAGAACASGHIETSLGVFPTEAQSRPLYWAVESATTTQFTIRIMDVSCDGSTSQVNYAAQDGTARTAVDYTRPPGVVTVVNGPGHPTQVAVDVQISNDPIPDVPVVKEAKVLLTSATNATVVEPSSAPLFIVDEDGPTPRVAMTGGNYEEFEGTGQGGVPVFRGGDASGSVQVAYTVTAGTAQAGRDYQSVAQGTVMFGPNERSKLIPITVLDDLEAEEPESLTVAISGTGVAEEPSSATFTILDNEETERPESRIHHPINRKKYRSTDFRIREIHVFTEDNPGGSGVVAADFAIRRNLKNGKCTWWAGKRFRPGPCNEYRWKDMRQYETDFFYLSVSELAPTKGKIRDYTAFSRATDGAGNAELFFNKGRNANTFEIKKPK